MIQTHVLTPEGVEPHEDVANARAASGTTWVRVSDGTPEHAERSVTPTGRGNETVRIGVLLYYDEPPATPTVENAVEETHFWVTVTEGSG